jgi:hypothetical protein
MRGFQNSNKRNVLPTWQKSAVGLADSSKSNTNFLHIFGTLASSRFENNF